jgi:acetyl-CoA acetyltransferase
MDDIYVIGTGMTPFGKFPSLSVRDLTRDAVSAALSDAACAIGDIEVACFANAAQGGIEGQYMIPGQIALRAMGFETLPIVNIENACASASSAFYLACMHLKAAEADVALAVGVDKMNTPEKQKAFDVLAGAQDVHDGETTLRNLALLARDVGNAGEGQEQAHSVFMDVYASLAKQHMRRFGSTQRMFAVISAKNHVHSVHNPLAQYRTPYTVEEVLAARPIAWPLTLPMCAPVSDGAAAAIVCTGRALHRFERARAIKVYATVLASGSDRGPEELGKHITRRAANLAYERAGLGPRDMSVAEVHDATAVGELIQTENLGFCEAGGGGELAERGDTSIGGRIPVNPSGGLECKGHPIGATGLGQIHELTMQLRGEAGARQVERARFGIAENGGGFHGFEEAAACMTILGRN